MQKPTLNHLDRSSELMVLISMALIFLIWAYAIYNYWQLLPDGTTPTALPEIRMPYWDFTNLWGGSLFVAQGQTHWLFDLELYRTGLNELFNVELEPQEWSYPPHILLVGGMLAKLPIMWAYLIWTFGALLAFALVLRSFKLPKFIYLFVLLSPSVWATIAFGQNGTITAALLIGGLYFAPTRPILAGIMFGFLTMKPHLGLLIPFCLLASYNWRAILSSGVTTAILIGLTTFLFGTIVWEGFLNITSPLMASILEAPFPQGYHVKMYTGFAFARSIGLDVTASYVFQAIMTIGTIIMAFMIWRPKSNWDHATRVITTAMLALISTPYAYIHDGSAYYLALGWYLVSHKNARAAIVAFLWIIPILLPKIISAGLPMMGVVLYLFALGLLIQTHKSNLSDVEAKNREDAQRLKPA